MTRKMSQEDKKRFLDSRKFLGFVAQMNDTVVTTNDNVRLKDLREKFNRGSTWLDIIAQQYI